METFTPTLLAEMGPTVTAAKILSLYFACLCGLNRRSQEKSVFVTGIIVKK